MSHWLTSSADSSSSAAASWELAAELRLEASRLGVLADLLARAHRAIPGGAECEGWMGRARTTFDERVRELAAATLAGSHYAEAAASEYAQLATEAEESAARSLALSGTL